MSWRQIGQIKKASLPPSGRGNSQDLGNRNILNTKILSTNRICFLGENKEDGQNQSQGLEINAPSIHLNTNNMYINNDFIAIEGEDLHVNTNMNTHLYGNTFIDCPRFKCVTLANTPQIKLNKNMLMQSSYFFLEYQHTSRIVFLKTDLASFSPVNSNQDTKTTDVDNGLSEETIFPSFYAHKITFLLQKASKQPHELPEIRIVIQTPTENIIVRFDSPSSSLELLWHPAGEWKILGLGFKTIIES